MNVASSQAFIRKDNYTAQHARRIWTNLEIDSSWRYFEAITNAHFKNIFGSLTADSCNEVDRSQCDQMMEQ